MSNFFCYDFAENTPENEEALKKIADWWIEQEGKQFRMENILGTLTSPSTGVKPIHKEVSPFSFAVKEPKLEGATLSFKKERESVNIPVRKLELDLQKQELKVFYSDEFPNSHYALSLARAIQFNW